MKNPYHVLIGLTLHNYGIDSMEDYDEKYYLLPSAVKMEIEQLAIKAKLYDLENN